MAGQGLDKTIETVEITELDFFDPAGEPSFAFLRGLSLNENGGQFFPKGISLMKLWLMDQQVTQASPLIIIQC